MPKTKSKKINLAKGSMQIVTIKYAANSLATHQQELDLDDLDEPDDLDEFNL